MSLTTNPTRSSGIKRLRSRAGNSMLLSNPDLGLICLGVFVMLVGVGAIIPVRAIYARDHGATPAELGLMASSYLLGSFAMQLPGGIASDRWGRKPLLVSGIAAAGIITFLFLLWDQPWYFIALRFIEGVASGAINPAASAYVMDTVPVRERGAAFGWYGSAQSAGLMLGPAFGGILSDAFGYPAPFIFGGATSLITAAYLFKVMRNYKPGQRPVQLEEPEQSEVAREEAKINRHSIPRSLFKPALVGALVLIAAGGIEDGLFISLWTLWLNDLHASNSFVGLTFITFSLPLMVLMPFTGKWADKFRLAPLIALPAALVSVIYLIYGLTDNLLLIAALGIIEGTLLSIRLPATIAYTADISPDNARGRIQGLTSTTRTVFGFASSMVVTLLYYVDHHYPFIMLASTQIVVSVVGGVIIWRVEQLSLHSREQAISPAPAPMEV